MSFAATLGLVALVQIGMPRLFATPDHSATARVALWGGRELVMLLLASLIAGLATTPYAAFHFHRVTHYGVLANLAAMPVVSALVMPAGLLGLLAAPFGLDGLFWWLMGLGIDWMIAVSQWVANLPGRNRPHRRLRRRSPDRGKLRHHPDGAVAHAATLVGRPCARGLDRLDAWRTAAGYRDLGRWPCHRRARKDLRLHVMRTGKDAFLVKEWLAADADTRNAANSSLADGVSCDEGGYVVEIVGGGFIAQSQRPEAIEEDCARRADRHRAPDAWRLRRQHDRSGAALRQGSMALAQGRWICGRDREAQGL